MSKNKPSSGITRRDVMISAAGTATLPFVGGFAGTANAGSVATTTVAASARVMTPEVAMANWFDAFAGFETHISRTVGSLRAMAQGTTLVRPDYLTMVACDVGQMELTHLEEATRALCRNVPAANMRRLLANQHALGLRVGGEHVTAGRELLESGLRNAGTTNIQEMIANRAGGASLKVLNELHALADANPHAAHALSTIDPQYSRPNMFPNALEVQFPKPSFADMASARKAGGYPMPDEYPNREAKKVRIDKYEKSGEWSKRIEAADDTAPFPRAR